jgi:hypothetical protein
MNEEILANRKLDRTLRMYLNDCPADTLDARISLLRETLRGYLPALKDKGPSGALMHSWMQVLYDDMRYDDFRALNMHRLNQLEESIKRLSK